MKKSLGLALLALACGTRSAAPSAAPPAPAAPAAPAPPSLAEAEPNDAPAQAQPVSSTIRVQGDLHPVQPASRPDEDWYAIRPGGDGKTPATADLRAELLPPAGVRFSLEVYDRDLNKLLSLPCSAGAGCLVPGIRVRGQAFLRVFSPTGATGTYALDVRLSPPDLDAEAEPNDRPVDATPLPLDHPLHGTIGTPADEDWYVLDLAPDGGAPLAPPPSPATATKPGAVLPIPNATTPLVPSPALGKPPPGAQATAAPAAAPNPEVQPSAILQLQLSGVPGLRLGLRIFDQDQRPLLSTESRQPGDPIELRDLALFPTSRALYLLVESAPIHGKRPAAPGSPYTLAVHRDPAPADFEAEPNDTPELATPISAKRVGYLAPRGDVDYYRVHVTAPSLLHARVSGLDRVDAELSVVDPPDPTAGRGKAREKLLWKANEGGPHEPEVIPAVALPPGDHYVKVEAAAHQVGAHWVRDQDNETDPYELDVTLSPDDGNFEKEPNGDARNATPVRMGETVRGYAFPAKDVDVYRLDLSSQPVGVGVVLRLQGVPKTPLVLELRGPLAGPPGPRLDDAPLVNTSDHGRAGHPEEIHAKLTPGVWLFVVRPSPEGRVPGQPGGDPDAPYALSIASE